MKIDTCLWSLARNASSFITMSQTVTLVVSHSFFLSIYSCLICYICNIARRSVLSSVYSLIFAASRVYQLLGLSYNVDDIFAFFLTMTMMSEAWPHSNKVIKQFLQLHILANLTFIASHNHLIHTHILHIYIYIHIYIPCILQCCNHL